MWPEKDRIALQLRLGGGAAAEGGRRWPEKNPQTYKPTRFDTRFFWIRTLLQKIPNFIYSFIIIPQKYTPIFLGKNAIFGIGAISGIGAIFPIFPWIFLGKTW